MTLRGEGKYWRLLGGWEHYGRCIIEIEPLPLGSGILFENVTTPDEIPLEFVPSAEKGARVGVAETTLPFKDMLIRLVGGSWHEVDSKPSSFVFAGEMAVLKAKPFDAEEPQGQAVAEIE